MNLLKYLLDDNPTWQQRANRIACRRKWNAFKRKIKYMDETTSTLLFITFLIGAVGIIFAWGIL